MSLGVTNYHTHTYTGVYINNDYTESVYSYRFILKDDSGNIEYDSGEMIHNSANDDNLSLTTDICNITQDLSENKKYFL
jgi:hypothetical protein